MAVSMIPPVGTSAYKAYQRAKSIDSGATAKPFSFSPISSSGKPLFSTVLGNTNFAGSALDNKVTSAYNSLKSSVKTSSPRFGGSVSTPDVVYHIPSSSGSSAQSLDYLNAELAKYYGMSRETAYQEALSNTAYQRAVTDMQAAGLNPAVLFGAGRASIADGVSYVSAASSGDSSGYSGFTGGYSGSRGSGSSKRSGYLFSTGTYGAVSAAAGLAGMALMHGNPAGYWIGSQTAKGVMTGLNSLFK